MDEPAYLTRRQYEVLDLLARGLTRTEAGERLGIGAETVKAHIERAMRRLGARNIAQAAYRLGQGQCLVRDGRTTPQAAPRPRPAPKPPNPKPTPPRATRTKPVTDPAQRAYLAALDRYTASRGRDEAARVDMLLALEQMRASTRKG